MGSHSHHQSEPAGRAVLRHQRHVSHGDRWVLSYVDELGAAKEQYFPGQVTDLHRAVAAVTEFLAPLRELEARRAEAVATVLAWGEELQGRRRQPPTDVVPRQALLRVPPVGLEPTLKGV